MIEVVKMNPTEMRELIAKGPFSQRSAAQMIGMHERAFRRYLAEDRPIPLNVEFAIRYCVEHTDDPWIRQFIRPNGSTPGRYPGPTSSKAQYHAKNSGDPPP